MAFKMKAGKEGPMRKNFGKDVSPMNKPLVGNQKNLPDHLKQKILDSPAKLKVGDRKRVKGVFSGTVKGVQRGVKDATRSVRKRSSETTKSKVKIPKEIVGEKGGVTGRTPKKFIGKAIKGVGKFVKKNPALVGGLVGGPAGMLAGSLMKMKKKK